MPGGDGDTAEKLGQELAELKQQIADGGAEATIDATAKDLALRAARRAIELEQAEREDGESRQAETDALNQISADVADIRTGIVGARLRRGEPPDGSGSLDPEEVEQMVADAIAAADRVLPGPLDPTPPPIEEPDGIEHQVEPMMAGEHDEQVVLGSDPDAPEQLLTPIESQVQPMMAGEHDERSTLGSDPEGREDAALAGTGGGISTKALIRAALALFGATALGLGAYVFATGSDDDPATPPPDTTAAAPAETDEDISEAAADASASEDIAESGVGTDRGPFTLQDPTTVSVEDYAAERATGTVAAGGDPIEGAAPQWTVDFTDPTGPRIDLTGPVPDDPFVINISLATLDESKLALDASLTDGGAGPVADVVLLSREVGDDGSPLRYAAPQIELSELDGGLSFGPGDPLVVPRGLDASDGGEFDLFVTVGSIVDGVPTIQRFSAGVIEVPAAWFTVDESLELATFEDARRTGLAGAPTGVADCILETVPFEAEVLGFLDGTLGDLAVPCLFSASPLGDSAAAGLTGFAGDERAAVSCIGNGLGLRAVSAAEVEALALPWEEWPEGLLETYAAVLEECVPLEPFYLSRFGAFEYTRGGCPEAMTAYVLDRYSWQRFIVEGIISADAAERDAARARFEVDVNAGYPLNECFLA